MVNKERVEQACVLLESGEFQQAKALYVGRTGIAASQSCVNYTAAPMKQLRAGHA